MANYQSMEDLVASTSNMTTLFDGNTYPGGYDDNSYSDSGNSFTWNNILIQTVYANGNSYFGFNSDSMSNCSFLFANTDRKLYALYKETGKISGHDFLRYRWDGVSSYHYSWHQEGYTIIYDIVLVDNDRLYLNVVKCDNVSAYDEAYFRFDDYGIQTGVGTVSNLVEGGQYTIYCDTPGDLSSMTSKTGFDSFTTIRYLVKNTLDDNFYTYQNNSWSQVTANIHLASTFTTYGMTAFPSILPPEFEVWKWQDEGTVANSIEIIADPVSTDADNSVVFHITLDDATTIQNILANSDGLVEYSNDGTIWEHAISEISDPTDFYVRVVLLTYFTNLTVLYE